MRARQKGEGGASVLIPQPPPSKRLQAKSSSAEAPCANLRLTAWGGGKENGVHLPEVEVAMGTGARKDALPGTAPMEPDPEPAGPGAAEAPEVEHEGAGDPRSARPFLAWSAEEVAEWVVHLGFPQYEVRGCRPGGTRRLQRRPNRWP